MSAALKVKIAKRRSYKIAGISGNATADLSGASVRVTGNLLGQNRTFVDKSYSTDFTNSFVYYTGSKKFPKVRFAIGPVPVFAQPSIGAKFNDRISLQLQSFPEGGGSVNATYSPLIASATAGLKVGIGIKGANAGIKGKITVITGQATYEGVASIDDEGVGEATLKVFGQLNGPRGKLSLYAKLLRVKKEKELWKFRSKAAKRFTLYQNSYQFGDQEGILGQWNLAGMKSQGDAFLGATIDFKDGGTFDYQNIGHDGATMIDGMLRSPNPVSGSGTWFVTGSTLTITFPPGARYEGALPEMETFFEVGTVNNNGWTLTLSRQNQQ